MKQRVKRILGWGAFTFLALVVSGVFLADHLTPPATGAPSHALEVQRDQTALDRELWPLLDRHPGKTGAILLPDGLDAFAARALSARQAGRSLDLQYYIWHDDLTGHLLLHEAWQAAERGVRVRLLLDDINTSGKDVALLAMDSHANIEIRVYNPFRNRSGVARLLEMVQRSWSITHRMHNKAWIADGRVAVVGGRNIGVEYFDAAEEMNFRDLDMVLFGPAVAQASEIFDTFWNSDTVVPIAALKKAYDRDIDAVLAQIHDEAASAEARRYLDRVDASDSVRRYFAQELTPFWSENIRVVSDPPQKQDEEGSESWLIRYVMEDLRSARDKALLISPYFVPGDEGVVGLAALARRGVDVAVITNSLAANDVIAVHGAYANYRERLLKLGIKLHETRVQPRSEGSSVFGSSGASLHTKAYVIDDRRGFIGSFNMDPRSIDLNTEMGVMFDEPAIAKALREEFRLLASPELAYWVYLNDEGELRWLDNAKDPPLVLDTEPDASRLQRAIAWLLRWVPIESQL
ncbi:phospholipase D family protein [Luteimonas sp. RD2P54]|uniref:Phospholipase D family protein n=1 Tax=Luteimonas endophytica TaxID=3042023 RepID=A0ABT6JDJ6_9GAMM|nr:phospholipase D family protein [Luteimonas endophytica]MDH5824278.1 phospholipase D family protein [Luteimonas endophytica]